jgi:hypothetical protein
VIFIRLGLLKMVLGQPIQAMTSKAPVVTPVAQRTKINLACRQLKIASQSETEMSALLDRIE